VVVTVVVVEIRNHYLSCKKEASVFGNVKGFCSAGIDKSEDKVSSPHINVGSDVL
jgi:hypothetical protein